MLWVHKDEGIAEMTFALVILAGLLCMPAINDAVASLSRKD